MRRDHDRWALLRTTMQGDRIREAVPIEYGPRVVIAARARELQRAEREERSSLGSLADELPVRTYRPIRAGLGFGL